MCDLSLTSSIVSYAPYSPNHVLNNTLYATNSTIHGPTSTLSAHLRTHCTNHTALHNTKTDAPTQQLTPQSRPHTSFSRLPKSPKPLTKRVRNCDILKYCAVRSLKRGLRCGARANRSLYSSSPKSGKAAVESDVPTRHSSLMHPGPISHACEALLLRMPCIWTSASCPLRLCIEGVVVSHGFWARRHELWSSRI